MSVPDALRLLDPAQTENPIATDDACYFLQTRTGDGHPCSGDSSGSVGDEVQNGKFRLTFVTKPKNHGGACGTHDSDSTDR